MSKVTVTEFTACAECDSQDTLGNIRVGEDDRLCVCRDCGTVEPSTKTLWLNEETGEITADIEVANGWDAPKAGTK